MPLVEQELLTLPEYLSLHFRERSYFGIKKNIHTAMKENV
jgi:hypothetical protein